MPSILTHYGFNKEIYNTQYPYLNNNEDAYLLGAQGPDPFFFYGLVPFLSSKNGKVTRGYGSKLHKLDPKDVFEFFFEYANKSKEKDVLYSYILGAGLHYVLDRKVHPYVFYKTGFSDDKKMKRIYFVDHTLFETNMDVLLMNDRYREYKLRPSKSIETDKNKVLNISEMYEKLSKEVVREDLITNKSFYNAYRHMITIEKCLYSPHSVKKKIVGVILKNTPLNTMMHPKIVKDDEKIDYLNLKKNEWNDPATGVSFNKSIYDLIEEAKIDASEWVNIVNKAYEGNGVSEDLEKFTKKYIYDGYVLGNKMKLFKNVYGKGENLNDN